MRPTRLFLLFLVAAAAAAATMPRRASAASSADDSSICTAIGKANAKQPLKSCKPFRDGVCDSVRADGCSGKLCDTLKSEDGCDLATKADVLDSERHIYGRWAITLNEQQDACTAEPIATTTDPRIAVVCSKIGSLINIMRLCPDADDDGDFSLSVQGACGVQLNPPNGVYWYFSPMAYNSDLQAVTCTFKMADIPPELQGGRIFATATCGPRGPRPLLAEGSKPINVGGRAQLKA